MTLFASLALAVLTFAVVIYPFFRQRSLSVESVEDEKWRELHSKRDTTYAMLKELEFDFQSGILTEEDYRDLEARYKRKAVSILRNVDEMEKGSAVEDEIEKRVSELRRGKGAKVEDEIEKRVLELRRGKGRFCPQCGTSHQESDRFCSHCGVRLGQGERVD